MEKSDQPDPSKASELAQKIVNLLIDADSSTRGRAINAAMMLLGEKAIPDHEQQHRTHDDDSTVEFGQFFHRGEKLRPSENAQLCAAYHYASHGNSAFSLDDIRAIANEAGVVLPDRLDMTFASARHAGKKLFQPAGRGSLRPTAAAGVAFHERWGVRPGTKPKS